MTIREANEASQSILDTLRQDADVAIINGYKQYRVKVGMKDNNIIVSIIWPSWKIDVCSFVLTDENANNVSLAEKIENCDRLWLCSEDGRPLTTFAIRNQYTENNYKWIRVAYVYELLDAFLEGNWTPPWKCGFCRDRLKGTVKPNY
jgi:hypothetical protein